jgi:hypothetical protein
MVEKRRHSRHSTMRYLHRVFGLLTHAYLPEKDFETMKGQVIPWELFLAALKARFPRDFQEWLSFWRFGNEGVVFLDDLRDLEHVVKMLLPDPEEKSIH